LKLLKVFTFSVFFFCLVFIFAFSPYFVFAGILDNVKNVRFWLQVIRILLFYWGPKRFLELLLERYRSPPNSCFVTHFTLLRILFLVFPSCELRLIRIAVVSGSDRRFRASSGQG